jgi:hypothetical protein
MLHIAGQALVRETHFFVLSRRSKSLAIKRALVRRADAIVGAFLKPLAGWIVVYTSEQRRGSTATADQS